MEFEPYEFGEELLQADVSDGSADLEHQSEMSKLEARDTNKASTYGTWAEKDKHIHITNSPSKIKHVKFDQHSETVPDSKSCRWAESSQATEVFYNNPDWKAQCEDLPNNVEYPINWGQKLGIAFICDSAYICTREYQLLWCLSNELYSSGQQVKLTPYRRLECYGGDYSVGDVNGQEDNDQEDKNRPRSLIHGM